MKLSIITINRNNVAGLRKTLASVELQTCRDIEHIIVDGASTDGSVEVIEDYVRKVVSQESRVKSVSWTSEPDDGIYNAINKGIKRATGDYVWILNSGDCAASPDVVERMIAALRQTSDVSMYDVSTSAEVAMLMGNIVQVYPDGRKVREAKLHSCEDATPRLIDASMLTFYRGTIPHDAAFVRRDLFEKYGYFDESMKICADWKLYLDMIALGGVVPMYVDIDVVYFDMSGISNANNELRFAERRAYLEQVLPLAVLKDYDRYGDDIAIMQRLHRHPWAFGLTRFLERVLFKLEKWGILRR